MSKRNEAVSKAIQSARSVDRSHAKHHHNLMVLVSECAKEGANYLSLLSEYGTNRVSESPESLCTLATFAWFEKHFGVRVDKSTGEAKNGREFTKKGFTVATFEAARMMPWDKLAKEMAFKVPEAIAWSGAAATAAKLEVTGTALPTQEEVYREFLAAVTSYKSKEQFAEWVKLYHQQQAA